jgi:divalent metal cation (Fe/Co/Zn/Cd) transporter
LAEEAGDVKAGRQLLTDVFTSAGVLVGVAVATFIGWAILDPLIGALVALTSFGWVMDS